MQLDDLAGGGGIEALKLATRHIIPTPEDGLWTPCCGKYLFLPKEYRRRRSDGNVGHVRLHGLQKSSVRAKKITHGPGTMETECKQI